MSALIDRVALGIIEGGRREIGERKQLTNLTSEPSTRGHFFGLPNAFCGFPATLMRYRILVHRH
jgi:hypothetical protein